MKEHEDQKNKKKLNNQEIQNAKLNNNKIGRLMENKSEDEVDVRAYVYTDQLHDITDMLKDPKIAGIKQLRSDDQIVSMYEENNTPHFVYFEKKEHRIHLF